MPDLRSVKRARPQTAEIDLVGDMLMLTFDAERVTPRWMNDTMQALEVQDMLAVPKALAHVIIEWDLTDDGNPYLPSGENIAELSFPVVQELFEAVCRSAAPSDAEGNAGSPSASEPPSASASESPSSLNGGATETSPRPSASLSST